MQYGALLSLSSTDPPVVH